MMLVTCFKEQNLPESFSKVFLFIVREHCIQCLHYKSGHTYSFSHQNWIKPFDGYQHNPGKIKWPALNLETKTVQFLYCLLEALNMCHCPQTLILKCQSYNSWGQNVFWLLQKLFWSRWTVFLFITAASCFFNNSFIQIGRKGLLGLTGLLTQGVIDDCCFLRLTSSKYLLLVCEILVYYFCVCNLPR